MATGLSLRARLFLGFAGLHLGLTLAAGGTAWWWLHTRQQAQAARSAESIGRVLAQGGFSPSPGILARMEELTGYEFRLVDGPTSPRAGTIQVGAVGRTIEVVWDTPENRREARELAGMIAAWSAAGAVAFALVAGLLARRLARPVEALAKAAREIGQGTWEQPVPVAGTAEIAALARDLDGMRRQLIDLDQANRRAERLGTLGLFAATIAHEVRNPLTAVRLGLQMQGRNQGKTDDLALILGELDRLDLIIDGILAYAKGLTVERQPCALAGLAAGVRRLLQRQADHAGVLVDITGPDHQVLADPLRLRQLLLNLVLNAIQACQGQEDARVIIEVHPDGLTVSDNGPGFPSHIRNGFGQPFRSDRPGGTGLGLHLAYAIATAHGATLTILDGPGGRIRLGGLV